MPQTNDYECILRTWRISSGEEQRTGRCLIRIHAKNLLSMISFRVRTASSSSLFEGSLDVSNEFVSISRNEFKDKWKERRKTDRKTARTGYIPGNDSCGKRYAVLLLPPPPPPPSPFLPILFIRVRIRFPTHRGKKPHTYGDWLEGKNSGKKMERRKERGKSATVIGSWC